jgi:hypothetical protein
MTISYPQLSAFVNALQDASRNEYLWLGFDGRIRQLTASDLHFFETEDKAVDFIHYHSLQGRDITLLPLEATRYFLHVAARSKLQDGIPSPNISLDAEAIGAIHQEMCFNYSSSRLEELIDGFDWSKTLYDPLEANTEAENFEDKIQFNRLENLIESLSQFAQGTEMGKAFVSDLITRHWSGNPMETQIPDVLNGVYLPPHDQRIISSLNKNSMNMENLKFLQENIKYTGFGESLYPELEKNIQEKKPEFQLHFSIEYYKRPIEATLDFRKSDSSEMYFFNRYTARTERYNGEKMELSFPINKGKGFSLKEAFNYMHGRPVHREYVNSKKETYMQWRQLDFKNKDEKGNYMVLKYGENHGYDLRSALSKFPVKELDGGEKEKELVRSLERGNIQSATIEKNGEEIKVSFEANPEYKTINVYDEKFKLMKHEDLPLSQRPDAPVQRQDKDETATSQKQGVKNGANQKQDDKLLTKNRTKQNKGMKVS